MRKAPGDRIEVFDGAGRVAVAVIRSVGKSAVALEWEREERASPLPFAIHLLPAMIKAEAFEWLLEKAVELGAASVRPLVTARTLVHLSGEHLEKKLAKWRRHMIEAAKQCHTPFVPALHAPAAFDTALRQLPPESLKVMPALTEHSRGLAGITAGFTSAYAIIGPEGDFTSEEEALAQTLGFTPVTLGPFILRAETAALTTLAVLAHEFRQAGANR